MRSERPWGWYEVIDKGEKYKVKNIEVKPGFSLSLQMHYHRAEHWVVVEGTALVQLNDVKFVINKMKVNIYLSVANIAYLTWVSPLRIIEVQSGDYLEEDDIVRFQDDFGRA